MSKKACENFRDFFKEEKFAIHQNIVMWFQGKPFWCQISDQRGFCVCVGWGGGCLKAEMSTASEQGFYSELVDSLKDSSGNSNSVIDLRWNIHMFPREEAAQYPSQPISQMSSLKLALLNTHFGLIGIGHPSLFWLDFSRFYFFLL